MVLVTYRARPDLDGRGTNLKYWIYRLAGIFISVFFVYLAVRKVDLSESVRALGSVQPGWLLAAVLVYLSNFPVRALRWRRILWSQKALSIREMLVPVLVGHMANNVLPMRTGEIYRAHFLGRRAKMSRSGAMGSIVVERTLDGLMLVVVILLVLALFPQTRFLGGAALATGTIFLVLAAGILFYGFKTKGTNQLIERNLGLFPERLGKTIGPRLEFFLRGIEGVKTARGYLEAGVYTVVIWFLEAAAIALVITSFDITLPLSGYFLVFALAALGTTLPSGPGYVGPYQYAFVLALSVFAVSREEALAVSVAAQFSLLGSITVIGLVLLWREQLRTGMKLTEEKEFDPGEDKVV
jgi:uncharacterized protein (TIRG00374 family)